MENDALQDVDPRAPGDVPGAIDSTVLLFDAGATLLRLAKAEGRQWLESLPRLLLLELYRLPVLLLAWIGFGVFLAVAVHALSGSPVLAALCFFLLQLGLALCLQRLSRRLRARMEFRQTREGLAMLRAGLRERVNSERVSSEPTNSEPANSERVDGQRADGA